MQIPKTNSSGFGLLMPEKPEKLDQQNTKVYLHKKPTLNQRIVSAQMRRRLLSRKTHSQSSLHELSSIQANEHNNSQAQDNCKDMKSGSIDINSQDSCNEKKELANFDVLIAATRNCRTRPTSPKCLANIKFPKKRYSPTKKEKLLSAYGMNMSCRSISGSMINPSLVFNTNKLQHSNSYWVDKFHTEDQIELR